MTSNQEISTCQALAFQPRSCTTVASERMSTPQLPDMYGVLITHLHSEFLLPCSFLLEAVLKEVMNGGRLGKSYDGHIWKAFDLSLFRLTISFQMYRKISRSGLAKRCCAPSERVACQSSMYWSSLEGAIPKSWQSLSFWVPKITTGDSFFDKGCGSMCSNRHDSGALISGGSAAITISIA